MKCSAFGLGFCLFFFKESICCMGMMRIWTWQKQTKVSRPDSLFTEVYDVWSDGTKVNLHFRDRQAGRPRADIAGHFAPFIVTTIIVVQRLWQGRAQFDCADDKIIRHLRATENASRNSLVFWGKRSFQWHKVPAGIGLWPCHIA